MKLMMIIMTRKFYNDVILTTNTFYNNNVTNDN